MGYRVILIGDKGLFTDRFRDTVTECGFELSEGQGIHDGQAVDDLPIFGISRADDIEKAAAKIDRPFIIYSAVPLPGEYIQKQKENGLIGVITADTAPEDIAFVLNKALFYDKMLKRNPRVPVSLPVTLNFGSKIIKSFASLLSREGMFIITLNPLPINALCSLKFSVPGFEREFSTEARVLYQVAINKDLNIITNPRDPFKRLVAHPGMAVFFTDMAEQEKDMIDRYIETIL